jgi:hypothetical protein
VSVTVDDDVVVRGIQADDALQAFPEEAGRLHTGVPVQNAAATLVRRG